MLEKILQGFPQTPLERNKRVKKKKNKNKIKMSKASRKKNK